MKPISLVNLSFFDENENNIVSESELKTFHDFKHMQIYIGYRLTFWSELYNKKLKVEPNSIETLIAEESRTVLRYVCEFMGVDLAMASSDLRDTEYVEARRFAINICHMRKMGKSSIGKGLNMDHSNVIYHIKKHGSLIDTEKYYESRFIQTYEYVMEKIGGNYREDGSGKPKEDESKEH